MPKGTICSLSLKKYKRQSPIVNYHSDTQYSNEGTCTIGSVICWMTCTKTEAPSKQRHFLYSYCHRFCTMTELQILLQMCHDTSMMPLNGNKADIYRGS